MDPETRQLRGVPHGDATRSDDELLLAVGEGDRDAFAELYDRFVRLVHRVVVGAVRDPSQAEEVTQEVLVELWRTAARFDPDRGAARTWILTMAHRRAIDRVRSEQSSRSRTERIGHRDRPHDFDEVSERVETAAEYDQVRAALDQLTDLQRQAVELAYYQGHTYREVAELLGTPLGTIKTRMRDGLNRLRHELGVMS